MIKADRKAQLQMLTAPIDGIVQQLVVHTIGGVVTPAQWMDLAGRAQATPDRNTRGYIDAAGHRQWLDVFADIAGQPQRVSS